MEHTAINTHLKNNTQVKKLFIKKRIIVKFDAIANNKKDDGYTRKTIDNTTYPTIPTTTIMTI
jgi:hypothetical protein